MSTAAHALVGKTLAGKFRLTGYIGEGAMASVFRGEQDREPRDLAVKVMHPHLAVDSTFVKRFQREAKAAARLNHPNSVQIFDCGVDGTLLYIAMELLGGQDLYDILVRERRLPEARSARIVIQTCEALIAAHGQGIVHRDLKPENIMLTPDPDSPEADLVKVLDFGIAKIMERDAGNPDDPPSSMPNSVLTTVGTVMGTPAYMSPEQCRGEPVDGRSDIYACGVLLYQLVTGRTPFTGESPIDIAMAHVREEPAAPSSHMPGMNGKLEQVILKALGKWPAQRQQTAEELKEELLALLPELPQPEKRRAPPRSAGPVSASAGAKSLPGLPAEVKISSQRGGEVIRDEAPLSAQSLALAPTEMGMTATTAPLQSPLTPAEEARARAAVTLRPPHPEDPGLPLWVMVPLAVVAGVLLGLLVFFLAR